MVACGEGVAWRGVALCGVVSMSKSDGCAGSDWQVHVKCSSSAEDDLAGPPAPSRAHATDRPWRFRGIRRRPLRAMLWLFLQDSDALG